MKLSLLSASVEYVAYRYQEPSDGCVSIKDAVIPGTGVVYLSDMDHFGPAWWGFPSLGSPQFSKFTSNRGNLTTVSSSDTYDPVRVKLILIGLLVNGTLTKAPK